MKKLLTLLLLLPMLAFGAIWLLSDSEVETQFTHELIKRINPDTIIGPHVLMTREGDDIVLKELSESMLRKGIMRCHPIMGCFFKPGSSVNIIIESNGGSVGVATRINRAINQMRNAGVSVNCYVNRAFSAAFYLLSTICDRRIAVGIIRLGQHRSYSYGIYKYSAGSLKTDIRLAKEEAISLGQNEEEWLKLTRGTSEVFDFTPQQIEKYKLIDQSL